MCRHVHPDDHPPQPGWAHGPHLQLAQAEQDPQTGLPRARILYNFGREEAVDRAALAPLARSLSRFVSPEDALQGQAAGGPTALRFLEEPPAGGRLGEVTTCGGGWASRTPSAACCGAASMNCPRKRALFALVANRALAPSSKLGGASGGTPATIALTCRR